MAVPSHRDGARVQVADMTSKMPLEKPFLYVALTNQPTLPPRLLQLIVQWMLCLGVFTLCNDDGYDRT